MSITWILGIAILVTFGSLLLRQYQLPLVALLTITGCGLILLVTIEPLREIVAQIKDLLKNSGEGKEWLGLLIKALGICYVCRLGAELCRDAGQSAMAGYVELAGRIFTVSLSLPMLAQVVSIIVALAEL